MVSECRLTNGIRVVSEQIASSNSVAFGVWIAVGSQNEHIGNNGIAHMIEHMVFKGTEKRTAVQIADEIAEVGGNVDAYTSKEVTSYYAWVLPENLSKTIDLLGDMLSHSQFLEEEFEKEKSIVMEEIDMYKDSPEDVAHEMLQKKVWDPHPLGFLISGERQTVETFTREEVLQFMKDYYTADRMILSVAGNFDREKVLAMLETAFGGFVSSSEKGPMTASVVTPEFIFGSTPGSIQGSTSGFIPEFTPAIYIEEKDIEQTHINLAFDSICSTGKERYTFAVLNSILGGSVNSRMFMKIREEMGIAYAIYSYGSTYQAAGLFHIYAGVNPSQVENCIAAMGEQIRIFAKEGPTAAELIRAKEQIKTDLMIQYESTKGHMNSNAKELRLFGRVVPLSDTLALVNQVKAEDVIAAMEQYFHLEKVGVGLVGNLDWIAEDHCSKIKKIDWIQSLLNL